MKAGVSVYGGMVVGEHSASEQAISSAPDWSLEAEKVAKSMAPGMISELQRICGVCPTGLPVHYLESGPS